MAVILLTSGLLTAFTTQAALPPTTISNPLRNTSASGTPSPTLEATPTLTPMPPTPTLTATRTLISSKTPTITVSPQPTPVWAMIDAGEGGGAWIRKEPNGEFLVTVLNGTLVQVLPDLVTVGNINWVHVLVPYGETSVEGWIVRSLLLTATPAPDW